MALPSVVTSEAAVVEGSSEAEAGKAEVAAPRPLAVRLALGADAALGAGVLPFLPLLYPGTASRVIGLAVALTVLGIARGGARQEPEAFFYQGALFFLISMRVLWAYRPFGVVATAAILNAWMQPGVLAYFRILPARWGTPISPVVAAGLFLAMAQIGWLSKHSLWMFTGYRLGALEMFGHPWAPRVLAGALFVGCAAAILRFRLAWLVMPILLTPALIAVHPAGWTVPLLLGWITPDVRAWFGIPRLSGLTAACAVAAIAPPLLACGAFAGWTPVGHCTRDGRPLMLIRQSESPLVSV